MLKNCKILNIFSPQYLRKSPSTKRGQSGGGGTKPLGADQAPRSHGLPPHVVARRRLPAAATTPREGIRGLHIPTGDPPLEHKTDSPPPTREGGAGGRGEEAHHPRHTRDPKQRGARAQRARALSGGRRQGTTLHFSSRPVGAGRLDAAPNRSDTPPSKRPTPTNREAKEPPPRGDYGVERAPPPAGHASTTAPAPASPRKPCGQGC